VRLKATLARLYTAALVSALTVTSPAFIRAADGRSSAAVANTAKIRIDNFGQINPTYYRGAQPKDRDYADLAKLGIKTLINLTSDDADASEQAMAERAGMQYLHIPMTTHQPPTPDQLATFLKSVNDPASQPVYVHCVGGRHRTGVMTAAYRMTKDAWTADQAFKEMKRYKFGPDFLHAEFKAFVYGFRTPVHETPSPTVIATTVGR
jgi:tyrosine-protein phosphatase SIW14